MGKEKERFWNWAGWPEWVIIASVPIIAIGVAAIVSPDFRCLVADSTTAAWVQAIGVLAAIAIAIWSPRQQVDLQDKRSRRSRKHQQHELLHAAAVLSGHATRAMRSATKKIEIDERPIRIERLDEIQQGFRILLGKDMPTSAISLILEIQCEIAYQISAIELNNIGKNNIPDKREKASNRTKEVERRHEQLCELGRIFHGSYT